MKRRLRRALRGLRWAAAQVGALLELSTNERARRAGAVISRAGDAADDLERQYGAPRDVPTERGNDDH